MLLILAALAVITGIYLLTSVVMRTLVAGVRGESAPVRWLNPIARQITVKSEMLEVEHEHRELVRR